MWKWSKLSVKVLIFGYVEEIGGTRNDGTDLTEKSGFLFSLPLSLPSFLVTLFTF